METENKRFMPVSTTEQGELFRLELTEKHVTGFGYVQGFNDDCYWYGNIANLSRESILILLKYIADGAEQADVAALAESLLQEGRKLYAGAQDDTSRGAS